jgi:hypothetical protein
LSARTAAGGRGTADSQRGGALAASAPAAFSNAGRDLLAGQQVVAVRRRGKYLLLRLPRWHRGWLSHHSSRHVGQSAFRASRDGPGETRSFGSGLRRADTALCRSAALRAWCIGRRPARRLTHCSAVLGIEPLADEFTARLVVRGDARRAGPIKPLLMDSHLVVGIGNIYAAESLFRAGISPLRAAKRISRERYEQVGAGDPPDARPMPLRPVAAAFVTMSTAMGVPDAFRSRCGLRPCRRALPALRRGRPAGAPGWAQSTLLLPRLPALKLACKPMFL